MARMIALDVTNPCGARREAEQKPPRGQRLPNEDDSISKRMELRAKGSGEKELAAIHGAKPAGAQLED
jgi:hypothetical protein